MGRPRKYDKALESRVHSLAASGMTVEAVYELLRREGNLEVSRPTIGRIMMSAPSAGSAPQARDAAPEAIDIAPLKALIPKLTELVERAIIDEEPTVINSSLRTLGHLTTQLSRLEPPPPVDPNQHPDMVVAAAKARGKLTEYVERARAGK